jgi:hypothetical protein
MKNPLTLEAIKKIVEGNIKTFLVPVDESWSQKTQVQTVDSEGNLINGDLLEYKGLIGMRDMLAQTIMDVLTYATESGTLTANGQTAGSVSVGNADSDKNNTKVHIEHANDIEIKGANTEIEGETNSTIKANSGEVEIDGTLNVNSGNYTVDK